MTLAGIGALPPGLERLHNSPFSSPQETTAPETQPSVEDSGVEVVLSPEAQAFLNFESGAFGPAHSTAAKARFAVSLTPGLENLPFGKVVSALAHGIDPATLIAQPQDHQEQEDPLEGVEESAIELEALNLNTEVEEVPGGTQTPTIELALAPEEAITTTTGAELALALLAEEETTA